MPSERGAPRQIHEFQQRSGGMVSHVWAPGGRSILFVQGDVLQSIRVDGGGASPDVVYKRSGRFGELRFHPNGRLLAFTDRPPSSSTSSEVWVIENLREEMKLLASPARRP